MELIADKTQSLKAFTENNYAQASFVWSYLMKNREIKVNGKRVDRDILLQKGDTVSYFLTAKQAEKPAFYTSYEDDSFLVVDKESGVNSEAVFAALSRDGECYFIHRLDRNTKGLMIFARTQAAEKALLAAFKERRVEKKYRARLFGRVEKDREVLTAYLKKSAENALVKIFDRPAQDRERIVTEYEVLSRGEDTTLVEITLHTGRTHQIRAHTAYIGHPVVGDMKYGDKERNKGVGRARQCLVAYSLRLNLTGEFAYINDRKFTSRFTL